MAWTTVTLQVTTPLFNGGADPDDSAGFRPDQEAGVRVASIRGAMRFWFRALAGTLTGPDIRLLAALERRVFGGIGQRGGDESALASPLILRLPDPPRASRELRPAFLQGRDERWIGYLLGLGLMKLERGRPCLLRPFVPPSDKPLALKFRFQHDRRATSEMRQAIEALAFASLWLACTYGGLGARTRRGFGGLRITEVTGEVPYPWKPAWLATPDLRFYQSAEWLWPWSAGVFGVFERHLRVLINAEQATAGPSDEWTEPPPFPVLSKRFSPAVLVSKPFGSWEEALGYGGRQLRLFRANRPEDESSRRQARVRTAEWDDVVNGDSADFPLGALGLPVGFHDKSTDRTFMVNAATAPPSGPVELRRASPLWLRPVGSGDSWRLFTFAFETRFLPGPDAARVYLLSGGPAQHRELFVDQADVESLATQWMSVMRGGGDFTTVLRS